MPPKKIKRIELYIPKDDNTVVIVDGKPQLLRDTILSKAHPSEDTEIGADGEIGIKTKTRSIDSEEEL